MSTRIFYFEGTGGGDERWLDLEADGTLTYSTSPNYYGAKSGAVGTSENLTAAQAMRRWPAFADKISSALKS